MARNRMDTGENDMKSGSLTRLIRQRVNESLGNAEREPRAETKNAETAWMLGFGVVFFAPKQGLEPRTLCTVRLQYNVSQGVSHDSGSSVRILYGRYRYVVRCHFVLIQ